LVRPNQGLIPAGGSEVVQILLVEKDKNQLLASYNSLGAAALDHCKDKFLVQSVAVSPEQAANLQEYDQLTALWASNPVAVANKKLRVRHRVGGSSMHNAVNPHDMTKEQLIAELTALRRKYDELVAFAKRDLRMTRPKKLAECPARGRVGLRTRLVRFRLFPSKK
jgi:hypothetical protein